MGQRADNIGRSWKAEGKNRAENNGRFSDEAKR